MQQPIENRIFTEFSNVIPQINYSLQGEKIEFYNGQMWWTLYNQEMKLGFITNATGIFLLLFVMYLERYDST